MRRVYGLYPASNVEQSNKEAAEKQSKADNGASSSGRVNSEVGINSRRAPLKSLNSGFAKRFGDDHGFEFKKVPLRKKDGHLMSDVASPDESMYARRKLLQQERKVRALEIQKETQAKFLQMSYHLSSPAARMRSLIHTNQKK